MQQMTPADNICQFQMSNSWIQILFPQGSKYLHKVSADGTK